MAMHRAVGTIVGGCTGPGSLGKAEEFGYLDGEDCVRGARVQYERFGPALKGIGDARLGLRSLTLAVIIIVAALVGRPGCAGAAENQWPVADAGRFHVTCVGSGSVTLHGRGADPDGDAVPHAWRQSNGPAVSPGLLVRLASRWPSCR